MSNYEIKEVAPLTALDHQEIDYLRNFHVRMNSIPDLSIPVPVRKSTFDFTGFIRMLTLKYNQNFPHGSAKRKFAKSIVHRFPQFLQNVIVSALAPQMAHEHINVSNSLDLGFGIPTSNSPKVSIIIPVYNGVWITSRCLRALQKNKDVVSFEIIIVDDASTDQTRHFLQNLRGIRVIRNQTNLGYLKSTNLGASYARGKYIALLNNDTEPVSGWLDELVDVLDNDDDIAISGSTLIFEDGRLQESGGQIFSNANAWNLGRGSDPRKSEFRFVREADYCSAAAILVRGDFWQKVGGFDERYIPAYCEDSDLALTAWKHGHRVVVSPTSWVIHHEGSSHGNSTAQGTKKYQVLNTRKLFAKWENDLLQHWDDEGVPRLEASRNSLGIVVVCDRQAPSRVRDAGSVRTLQLLLHIKSLGYHVIFSATDFSTNEIELVLLEKSGIEVQRSKESLLNSLTNRVSRIRLFWLIRSEVFDYFGQDLQHVNQNVPTIADLIDLKYERTGDSIQIDKNQVRVAQKAQLTLFCSSFESKLLQVQSPNLRILDLWAEYDVVKNDRVWSERSGLLFVGGFRHEPNVEAIKFLIDSILPIIKTQAPDLEVKVVGTGLEREYIDKLTSLGVSYLGRVDDLSEVYSKSRVVIAPLFSGGGKKGKIGEALAHGVPVVTTSVGAEGFDFKNEIDAFISDDPDTFVKYLLSLEVSEVLWKKASSAAYSYAETNLSGAKFNSNVKKILAQVIGAKVE
jgi:GT2 family glycosyltransferase